MAPGGLPSGATPGVNAHATERPCGTVADDQAGGEQVTRPPVGLDKHGRDLWRQVVTDDAKLGALDLVLVAEACRIVDRLDHLDAVLRGKRDAWLTLAAEVEGRSEVAVIVDGVLAEARQQAGRLTSILAELRLRAAARTGATVGPASSTSTSEAATGVPAGVASIIGRARGGPRAG